MKKTLLLALIVINTIAHAQTPLLHLFENNDMRWESYGYSKGTVCNVNIPNYFTHKMELNGDSIVGGTTFKKLKIETKNCQTCGGQEICSKTIEQVLIVQENNTVIKISNNKTDTIFSLERIAVGAKALINNNNYSIVSIDSIDFDGAKLRRLNFERSFHYIDGVGFDNNGPIPNGVTYQFEEASSFLTCFQKNNKSYKMLRGEPPYTDIFKAITKIEPSPDLCGVITSLATPGDLNSDLVFAYNNDHGIDIKSDQSTIYNIDIYDVNGSKIQSIIGTTINTSSLNNGYYIAQIAFRKNIVWKKFIIQK